MKKYLIEPANLYMDGIYKGKIQIGKSIPAGYISVEEYSPNYQEILSGLYGIKKIVPKKLRWAVEWTIRCLKSL